MFSLNAKNIYDVVEPLHLCSQLLGLTSFSIGKGKDIYVAKLKLYNVLCLAITTGLISLFTSMFILFNAELWQINRVYMSEVFENSMFCVLLSFFFCLIPVNLWFYSARKQFAILLNLLVEVDEELQKMEKPINLRKHKKVVLFFVLSTKILSFIAIMLSYWIGRNTDLFSMNIALLIAMNFSIVWNMFVIFQFTFTLWAVKLRYENVNTCLMDNFLSIKTQSAEDGNDKLKMIASVHDKLVDVSESINRCYGFPVRLLKVDFRLIFF